MPPFSSSHRYSNIIQPINCSNASTTRHVLSGDAPTKLFKQSVLLNQVRDEQSAPATALVIMFVAFFEDRDEATEFSCICRQTHAVLDQSTHTQAMVMAKHPKSWYLIVSR